MAIDILLINVCNYKKNPIYPYAFIQVRALAKQYGLSIAVYDFLAFPEKDFQKSLIDIVLKKDPRIIAFHLRQLDSLVFTDYWFAKNQYFPLDELKNAVEIIRSATNKPIVIGGFGFSTEPIHVFRYIKPDFGINGEPDDFLKNFELVISRYNLQSIANLLYWDKGELIQNRHQFFDPHNAPEYDQEAFEDIKNFYGADKLFGDSPPTIPIEIARGCPFACYFCVEPRVKGKTVRRRSMNAVRADIDFLLSRNIRYFWLICSEMNIGSPALARELANLFIEINHKISNPPVRWHAYHLPRWLSESDLKLLYQSGFMGGWNDFVSLDDENLKQAKVPYRSNHAKEHLKTTYSLHPTGPYGTLPHVSLFLGNAYITPQAIAKTLHDWDANGFSEIFHDGQINAATRLFSGDPYTRESYDHVAVTTFPKEQYTHINTLRPVYYFPKWIINHFGCIENVMEFFSYIESTFLSCSYKSNISWSKFLVTSLSKDTLRGWSERYEISHHAISEIADIIYCEIPYITGKNDNISFFSKALQEFTSQPEYMNELAEKISEKLFQSTSSKTLDEAFLSIKIDIKDINTGSISPYRLYSKLIRHFRDNAEAIKFASTTRSSSFSDVAVWRMKWIFERYNIRLNEKYKIIINNDI